MEDTLQIKRPHDDWKFSVEIKENSKGEPAITIKAKDDSIISNAGDLAIQEYYRVKKELEDGKRY